MYELVNATEMLKKDLADEILKGENGNLGSLSQEELRELIG